MSSALVQDFTGQHWSVQFTQKYSSRQFDLKHGERVAVHVVAYNETEGTLLAFWMPVFTEWWTEEPDESKDPFCPECGYDQGLSGEGCSC